MRQKLESHFGLIMAVIIIIMILPRYMSSPKTEYDSIKFEQAVGELEPGTSVKLADLTPFEWETCYTFDPLQSKRRSRIRSAFPAIPSGRRKAKAWCSSSL